MPTRSQPNDSAFQAFLDAARQQASQTLFVPLDKLSGKQGVKQAAHAAFLTPDEPKQPGQHRVSGQKPISLGKGRTGPSVGDNQSDRVLAAFIQGLEAAAFQLSQDKAIGPLEFAALLQGFEDRQAALDEAVGKAQKLAVKALTPAEQRCLLAEKIAGDIRDRRDFVAIHAIIAAFVTVPWSRRLTQ